MKKIYFRLATVIFLIFPVLLLAANPKPLSIKKATPRSSESDVSICAQVDRYFSATDGVAAKPYIKLLPKVHFSVTLSYNEICLSGLKPRTEYTFSINQNIPLGKVKLDKNYQFTTITKNYRPSLEFEDAGYTLPSKGDISIPLKTTNIDKVAIALYRINRNNLIGNINQYGLFRGLSSYKLDQIKEKDGYMLWKKKLLVVSEKNHAKTTAVSIDKLLKKRESGVYILAATPINKKGEELKYIVATQWFMISDIGLFTLEGESGLHVYTKHLSNALAYKNVRLELIAKNNELLGEVTSKNGYALFSKNLLSGKRGLKAKAIYAYGEQGDFTVLDLSRPAHDLSDRGIDGRDTTQSYDAWIYSNRGIFRPGEEIPFHLLVRTALGNATETLKLSAKLYDSREVEVTTKLLSVDRLGHAEGSFSISSAASTGRWRIEVYAGDGKPIGRLAFLVEDFVPPKISLEILEKPEAILPKQPTQIKAVTKYLTGDILPDAKAEVEIVLHRAKNPFAKYKDYHFGKIDEKFRNQSLGSSSFKGGTEGNIVIPLTLKRQPQTSLPLSAHITLSVNEPGGRPVQKSMDIFYMDKPAYIGIKPAFEKNAIDINARPKFDLVYLQNAKPSNVTLEYRLIEEVVRWNWRSGKDGDWEYYKTYSDREEFTKGSILLVSGSDMLELDTLDWGSYRLELSDSNGIISSYRFTSGYEESISRSSPDRLPLAVDKQNYQPNEKVKVSITPKFTGPIMVSVANHRIIKTKNINAQEGKRVELEFVIDKEWGSSAYILVSAFRAQSKKLGATRAIGIAHISISDPDKIIPIELTYPEKLESSSKLTIRVSSEKTNKEDTYVTVSAVDKGILSLSSYNSPKPAPYFYGQRRLGIEIRDVYADLIKTIGAHAEYEVGAGDELEALLSDSVVANKRKIVALMSKVIKLDAKGTATVEFDIPDFQGALQLMAVAWSRNAVGSATGNVIIKDPISSEMYMPRFIAAGDRAEIFLQSSFDTDAKDGEYKFRVHTAGGIKVSPTNISYLLKKGNNRIMTQKLTLLADKKEDGIITLDVLHEGKSIAKRVWEIGVRAAYPQSYVRKTGILAKNKTLDISNVAQTSIWLQTKAIKLKLSGAPLLPTSSMTQELIDYSGRCAEQTTSRAMPWLKSKNEEKREIIQKAIERLTSMQKINGGIGLWNSSKAETWITAYVVDMLTQARINGYTVPPKNINLGLKWLELNLDRWSKSQQKQEADAYALYVLAKNNKILHSEILHHTQNIKSSIRSAQAWGHLAASLSMLGEKEQSKILFEKAERSLGNNSKGFYSNYGGSLRDKASLAILLEKSGLRSKAEKLFADLSMDLKDKKYLSTQEMSVLLRANEAIDIPQSKLILDINGKIHNKDKTLELKASKLSDISKVSNHGTAAIWYNLSFVATPDPLHYKPEENRGFSIEKKLYDLYGNILNIDQIKRNSRVVVVLSGQIQDTAILNPLITDWLPAGFEIENPTISGLDASDGLKWLGKKSPILHNEYRNDRFESALKLDNNNSFIVAYIARAVTAGDFTFPPAKIEDMYQPRYRAFSPFSSQKLLIKHREDTNTSVSTATQKEKRTYRILESQDYTKIYSSAIGDLSQYPLLQLNYLRNGIFAQAGLNFETNNPSLHKRFSVFGWYTPSEDRSGTIYSRLTLLQKENVLALLKEEKQRCGGLVLADFYLAKIKQLNESYLKKYSKQELRILRNSLIARHGLRFKDHELTKIFLQMPWYTPTDITASEILDSKMTDIERANVRSMLKMERQK